MKRPTRFVIILFLIPSCQNSDKVFDHEMINNHFNANKINYEDIASFLEDVSENYEFATLDTSENKVRLTLGNMGVQHTQLLGNNEVPPSIDSWIGEGHGLVMKENRVIYFQLYGSKRNGIEKSGGILKNLNPTGPKIVFSWVQSYQTMRLERKWYAYSINENSF